MGWMESATLHEISNQVFFGGISEKVLKEASEAFFDQNLPEKINPLVISKLEEAKANHHFVAIVSSSPDFLVKEIAKRLGVEEWLATLYQICEDGTIGKIVKCVQGLEKEGYVRELYTRTGISPLEMAAYTDSHLDLPLLKAVGRPVAVNPTPKLRKIARQLAWEIIE